MEIVQMRDEVMKKKGFKTGMIAEKYTSQYMDIHLRYEKEIPRICKLCYVMYMYGRFIIIT